MTAYFSDCPDRECNAEALHILWYTQAVVGEQEATHTVGYETWQQTRSLRYHLMNHHHVYYVVVDQKQSGLEEIFRGLEAEEKLESRLRMVFQCQGREISWRSGNHIQIWV